MGRPLYPRKRRIDYLLAVLFFILWALCDHYAPPGSGMSRINLVQEEGK